MIKTNKLTNNTYKIGASSSSSPSSDITTNARTSLSGSPSTSTF